MNFFIVIEDWLWNSKRKSNRKKLGCKFIRINPDEQKFNKFNAINEIHRHVKQSSKKSVIEKISKRLLELEFKSKHSIINNI